MAATKRPRDLIPAHQAAQIACCSARTLARKAAAGVLTAYRRPHLKTRYYSRREVEALAPREVT